MTAVQPGSAASSIVKPGMEYILPGWLQGLLVVMTILAALLLVVNLLQLTIFMQLTMFLKNKCRKKKSGRKSCDGKNRDTTQRAGTSNNRAETEGTGFEKDAENQSNCLMMNRDDDPVIDGVGAAEPLIPQEDGTFSSGQPEFEVPSIPVLHLGRDITEPPRPMYPVEITSSVNYNPLLPVQLQRVSGENAVFTLFSDNSVHPSEICFMGFNSAAYYSLHRFPNIFDFIDQQSMPVHLSKIQSMKLLDVVCFPTVSIKEGQIFMKNKGIIKVEVIK